MNPAGYEQIIAFLSKVDALMKQPLTGYLFGGAAITLAYDHENRTFDLDLVGANSEMIASFGSNSELAQKYHVYLSDLPEINLAIPQGWRLRAKTLAVGLKLITLKAADPYDIFISKLPRLEPKDIEDMQSLIKNGYVRVEKLLKELNKNIKEFKVNPAYLNNVKLAFLLCFSKKISVKQGMLVLQK